MHRYPTRYQQKLTQNELVYVVNLTDRSYFECIRAKAPRLAANLKKQLTKSDALISSDIGTARWSSIDWIVFSPEKCKEYVSKNFNHIY
jgi:hypothetical protein